MKSCFPEIHRQNDIKDQTQQHIKKKLTSILPLGALQKPRSFQQNLYVFQKSVDLLHVRVFGVEDVIERATTRHLEILLIQERRLGVEEELLALQTSSLHLTLGHFFLFLSPLLVLVGFGCVRRAERYKQ